MKLLGVNAVTIRELATVTVRVRSQQWRGKYTTRYMNKRQTKRCIADCIRRVELLTKKNEMAVLNAIMVAVKIAERGLSQRVRV